MLGASSTRNSSCSFREDAKELGYKARFHFPHTHTLFCSWANFQKHGWSTPTISPHLNTSDTITLLEGRDNNLNAVVLIILTIAPLPKSHIFF